MLTDPILHLGPGLRRQFLAPLWPACSGKGADTSGTPANLRAEEAESEEEGFNLPYSLPGHSKPFPDLLKRERVVVQESVPKLQNHSLPVAQRRNHRV